MNIVAASVSLAEFHLSIAYLLFERMCLPLIGPRLASPYFTPAERQ